MQIPLLLAFSLLCTPMMAQSWSYIGSSCPNTEGSAKIKIKSNGNIVSASFSFNQMYVKEWNGNSWNALPAPATTGVIGTFQLEMHQDTAYLGIGNNGFKAFKWNGSGWTQLGTTISGTFAEGNHDFVLDNNGVPYVCHSVNRNIYRFNGTTWPIVKTLPQGSFPVTYGYTFGIDNAINFNGDNELVYGVVALSRQFFKKLTSTYEEVLVGDTIARMAPFTQYSSVLKRNANGELFAVFGKFASRSFVKKLVGNNWVLYGDSSTFDLPSGFQLLEFANPNTLIMGISGSVDKKIYVCTGQNAPFQVLDLVSHTGPFYQLTDLDINPADGKPIVAFNCTPNHSVMRFESSLTSISEIDSNPAQLILFPNPANDKIQWMNHKLKGASYSIYASDGRLVQSGQKVEESIPVSTLKAGFYRIIAQGLDGKILKGFFFKD